MFVPREGRLEEDLMAGALTLDPGLLVTPRKAGSDPGTRVGFP